MCGTICECKPMLLPRGDITLCTRHAHIKYNISITECLRFSLTMDVEVKTSRYKI